MPSLLTMSFLAQQSPLDNNMSENVLIVGCGVFGLSTALSLAQAGYKVTAMDKYPVPSPWSAATDLNKIIRTEYADLFYSKLSVEALRQWQSDPLYKYVYVESGRVTLTPSSKENQHRAKFEQLGIENLEKCGVDVSEIVTLSSGEDLGKLVPQFADNAFGEIHAKYNPQAGYGIAYKSLEKVYEEAKRLGVKFVFGSEGTATEIIENKGVKTADGKVHSADKIVIALGAATGYIVNLENQISSMGLFVTHITLSEEEYQKYKDIPIFFSAEFGYFFPPDADSHEIKIALVYADTKNHIKDPFLAGTKTSLPRYKDQNPGDTFPKKGESHVRILLQKILPSLANHPLGRSKVCWISDTPTSDFLIDKLPTSDNIYIAAGDSGHGYKFLPNIGKYIRFKIEGKLEKEMSERWCWKPNPTWPTQMASRSKREHVEISDVDWWTESN
ncbi:CYFA0S02e06172g1_1 [Cyberlindnera fabianii]|uniref:CYFA0S02e06172g1_1 n=1 Tax=Cyberlindnera fabianii TaxID=36022 RepID=A0A061AMM6_CYBFA|nr:CYFA0S02e06172g1_1 [Cyberlindnera fabianii]